MQTADKDVNKGKNKLPDENPLQTDKNVNIQPPENDVQNAENENIVAPENNVQNAENTNVEPPKTGEQENSMQTAENGNIVAPENNVQNAENANVEPPKTGEQENSMQTAENENIVAPENNVQNEHLDDKPDMENSVTNTSDEAKEDSEDSDHDKGMTEENKMQKKEMTPRPRTEAVSTMYDCVVGVCKVKKGSKSALLKHIKDEHKTYRFKCTKCNKSYERHPALKKHLLYHKKEKRYTCDECDAGYMFPGELEEHYQIHTGDGLIVCEKKGCTKSYASKCAMKLHLKSHNAQDVQCTYKYKDGTTCAQDCVDENHLKQHIRGMHGKGWRS